MTDMKLTAEQIAKMAPLASHIRVDGSIYQMGRVDNGALQYSDPDEYLEFYATFDDLAECDVKFYKLIEMQPRA